MRCRKDRKPPVGGLGGMVSAMIPGAKVDNKGRIMVNVGTSKDTIIFNIGGQLFETYRSTLFRLPNSPLANEKFLRDHYRPDKKDYFFDRDPDVFRATLNFLRTGELHLPSYLCGPAAKMELEYWGILPNRIERCCWTNYNDWNSTLKALDQLEDDRKGSAMSYEEDKDKPPTLWTKLKPQVWNFFECPETSRSAKLYGYLSLFFVILSIFSFVASTTEYFAAYTMIQDGGNTTGLKNDVINENVTNSIANGKNNESIIESVRVRVKHPSLDIVDILCLVFFTLEYIIRVAFAPKKLKFVTSTMGVIDLLALLPDYLEYILFAAKPEIVADENAINFISIFLIVRVLRIFRLIKHIPGLWILVYTIKSSVGELVLLTCFMSVGILVFSSLIFFADSRENFASIPDGFWWAIVTMTTVGYGDMYPTTTLGKLVGSLCAMSGLIMIGFSVPALVNNFMMYHKHVQFVLQAESEARKQKQYTDEKEGATSGEKVQCFHLPSDVNDDVTETSEKSQTNNNETASEQVPLITIENTNGETS
ncbi:potassium voltage-gated channel protein Shaw-like isoform X2 [Mya arenaria]|nr:potassium voltage-gated channel protein Shaw-like isoform X2 [Mya arenaria]XP_052821214.1 potassium voltage-gated channel protein Shaw-like isoform X2 [Mya arenaria]XP_052821215.1 potassium voltage-gated channel protein Shaw-like isoform X2 [Mya arenaria]XP_052821216.1 potassium voltage-gated channel protein Shaw-like isoform X2 [Mya arenaria]